VYHAIDTLVAELIESLPDVVTMVFTPHGMGANNSDIASMVLLGELMARWSGHTTPDLSFPTDEHGLAVLGPDDSWGDAVWRAIDERSTTPSLLDLPRRLGAKARAFRRRTTAPGVDWIPLVRHQPRWHTMRAFALPSYYDGRIRVNLRGREALGCVEPADYDALLDEIETLLRACRDPRTGEPLVASIDRPDDPWSVTDEGADVIVHWHGTPFGVEHDDLGRIGPIPARRTGGHRSPYGAVFVTGPDVEPVDLGDLSPFDLVPTAFELTGCASPWELSGRAFAVPTTG
jgi:predicted AlkP superfamily phosphohydrolase/phosphomutase